MSQKRFRDLTGFQVTSGAQQEVSKGGEIPEGIWAVSGGP